MNHQVKDKFIILRKIKYGEADLIIHALSSKGEKVSFIARSALRSKKRFGGGLLEPLNYVQLGYRQAADLGQLNALHEAYLISDFAGVRQSYDHLELALHVVDCVGKVSQEGDHNSEFLFNLLGHTLKAIEVAKDVTTLKVHFHLKFLLQQGVMVTESWMNPFLSVNISESNSLEVHRKIAQENDSAVSAMVRHYIANAMV